MDVKTKKKKANKDPTVSERSTKQENNQKPKRKKMNKDPTVSEKSTRDNKKKKKAKKDPTVSEKSERKDKKPAAKSDAPSVEEPSVDEDEKLMPASKKPSIEKSAEISTDEDCVGGRKAKKELSKDESEEQKMERLKKKIAAKKANKEKLKKKRDARAARTPEKEKKKKGLGEKIKDKFKAFANMFQTKKAEKAHTKAQNKMKGNKNLGKVRDGDDAVPTVGGDTMAVEDDVWIEDPDVIEDRTHRKDLELVKNNDNEGQLFVEGKRPFWKNKIYRKEVPPPIEKIGSKLLTQMMKEKKQLTDPAPEPDIAYDDDLEELKAKDAKWFSEEQYVANTIRSIICTMDDDEEVPVPSVPLKPLTVKEPTTYVGYYRHDRKVATVELPFKRNPAGKPRRLTKKKSGSTSDSSE